MKWDFGTEAEFLDKLTAWETTIEEREALSEEILQDTIKSVVISERSPKALAEHIILNSARLDTYRKIRQCAVDYMVTKGNMGTAVAPMDIGYLGKGQGGKDGRPTMF